MSKHTVQVDQFLLNKLQPEIDSLNLSLVSMEENGYDNKPMRETKNKLEKLVITHDFLKEYAYGNEEMDDALLRDIMAIAGSYSLSTKSRSQIIQSTRDSSELNERGGCQDFIRIYINDEILKSKTLSPTSSYTELKVYASDSVESISVVFTVTGSSPVTYTGVNYVIIPDVELDVIDAISLDVTTINFCGETIITTEDYSIKDISCSASTYWTGSTTERFKISISDLNESSDITIDPNSGTNVIGTELDYDWVNDTDADMTEFIYRESITQTITVDSGDSHALLLIPVTLVVTDVNELVAGTPVDMTEGINYDIFQITNAALKQFNCIYFRDLTSLTFPDRIFQFTINQV